MIERVAMDPGSDLEKLERMIELKERHDASNAKALFAEAFSRASSAFPTIPLRGTGHNNKKYATLEDITKLTRPVLSENGLALTFAIKVEQDVIVTAKLMHKAGHCEETSIALPRENSGSKNAVQAVGSSQTYGQRYTAQAILGLSLGNDTEDDGRSTGAPVEHKQSRSQSWAQTIVQDMPENASPRDKAETIADAICAQWKRMKGVKQIDNEWDRRAEIISKMEIEHHDLWEQVIEGYNVRRHEIDQEKG